jgi:hypothetical protein
MDELRERLDKGKRLLGSDDLFSYKRTDGSMKKLTLADLVSCVRRRSKRRITPTTVSNTGRAA